MFDALLLPLLYRLHFHVFRARRVEYNPQYYCYLYDIGSISLTQCFFYFTPKFVLNTPVPPGLLLFLFL